MISEVYDQSTFLMYSAVYQYYILKKTIKETADFLHVSNATVSRLLKKAKQQKFVRLEVDPQILHCMTLAEQLKKQYGLKEVLVAPVDETFEENAIEVKKHVALEGARYLQRITSDDDVIGLSWGGTMYYLIQYLNPCQKSNSKVITLHGSIAQCDPKLSVESLVHRAAMAFGGKSFSIYHSGLCKTAAEVQHLKQSESYQKLNHLFSEINISISGVGALYPENRSILSSIQYLNPREHAEINRIPAYCDLMLRFLDRNGRECKTSMQERTLSIELEQYKKIPNKIIVASHVDKQESVLALLKGKLVDILIIDQRLGEKLIKR